MRLKARKLFLLMLIMTVSVSCGSTSLSKFWPFSSDDDASSPSKRLDALQAKIQGDDAASDKTKTLIVSGHPDYPPVMWRDGDYIVGAGPEIAKMILEELGFAVDLPFKGSWRQVQDLARDGDIDAIAGIYRTRQRESYLEYSVPFAKDPVAIFVAKGKSFPYAKWDDLIGKRGTTTAGDSFGHALDAFVTGKLTVARSAKAGDNFEKLVSGQADYFICALYSGLFEAERLGISDKIEPLPTHVAAEDLYIAFSKKSRYVTYLPEINKKIEALAKDGTIDKLMDEKAKNYMDSVKGPR